MGYFVKDSKYNNEFYNHILSISRISIVFWFYNKYYTTNKRSFFNGNFDNIIKRVFINNFRYLFINYTKTNGFVKLLDLFMILFFKLTFVIKLNNDILILLF